MAVQFDSNRDNWCTYDNFAQMYNNVYEIMVDTSVAVKLDAAAWFNKDGNEVPTEENTFGQQSSYKWTCLDLVLFMDKVGDNTS